MRPYSPTRTSCCLRCKSREKSCEAINLSSDFSCRRWTNRDALRLCPIADIYFYRSTASALAAVSSYATITISAARVTTSCQRRILCQKCRLRCESDLGLVTNIIFLVLRLSPNVSRRFNSSAIVFCLTLGNRSIVRLPLRKNRVSTCYYSSWPKSRHGTTSPKQRFFSDV